MIPAVIIKKKRDGLVLSEAEISSFIHGYLDGQVQESQMSALLMAIFFKGLNSEETLALTNVMLHSGDVLSLDEIKSFKVDKHSTGGVGDKTSLILGPIVAAAGLAVPMISGRGLGHTGGTLDKLESIPGFNTQLSLEQFRKALQKEGICYIGQTPEICPADKKIYALRDVTGTVESLPLICASILSKKLAEGIDGLVLDVKFGSGAFMKSLEDSRKLALALMAIARGAGKKVTALLTNMNQPLGTFAGNSVEVDECVRILKNERPVDGSLRFFEETRELSLHLSAHMLHLGGLGKNVEESYQLAEKTLSSGKAFEKFEALCFLHGGRLKELPRAQHRLKIKSNQSGFVHSFDTETIGWLGVEIQMGRARNTDVIEPTAGFEFHKKMGDPVKSGDILVTLVGADLERLKKIETRLLNSIHIQERPIERSLLIQEILT